MAGWRDGNLRHVYVDPAHARRGIATVLVAHAEADYHERTACTEIRAGVALHAEPFYRALGYRLISRAVAWDGSTYLQMTHALPTGVASQAPAY